MRSAARAFAFVLVVAAADSAAWSQTAQPEQSGSQTGRPKILFGVEPSPAQQVSKFKVGTVTRGYIPEAVDLSKRFPPPGQQEFNSCVAWAVGYAARSYYAAAATGSARPKAQQIASPAYIHNRIYRPGKPCSEAFATFYDAFELLLGEGAASLDQYPLDRTCADRGSAAPGALGFRIRDAELIGFSPANHASVRQGRAAAPATVLPIDVDLIKQKIAAGHPVLMSMAVGERFIKLATSEVYQGGAGRADALVGAPRGDFANHAVVAVGYDDRRQAVRIMNSWGTDWADGGFAWVGYDALRKEVSEAWTMVADQDPVKPSPEAEPRVANLAQTLKLDCADLAVAPGAGGQQSIQGFVSTDYDLKLARDYAKKAQLGLDVKVQPWPVCEALLTLREPLRAASRPSIRPLSGSAAHRIGSTLGIEVTAPDFPSFLYVFYLQADGTVVNLAPRSGVVRQQTPPRQVLRFGDGRDGRATFKVTPPTGHETIIAIAARSPLKEIDELDVPGSRPFRLTFVAEDGRGPEDRAFLSRLRRELILRPDPEQLPREIAADVLHITIED